MKRWREKTKKRGERGRGEERRGEERREEERRAYAPIHKRTYRFLIENKANNK